MKERNKNNSIIFLTTLSVYLGLVMVSGAMSPVLAQAALTRNFDIQDEIEIKDDLDKKPSDEELKELSGAIGNYFGDLTSFIEDLKKLHGIEKFDLDLTNLFLLKKFLNLVFPMADNLPKLPKELITDGLNLSLLTHLTKLNIGIFYLIVCRTINLRLPKARELT